MSNSNEHIEEFLDYYLNKEQSPDYAVLITGCWGSGKTYFIRHFLEKQGAVRKNFVKKINWLTGFKKYTVVYVSLFGVKTREDINKKIERIFRPKINSKKLEYLPDAISLVSNLAGIAVGTIVATTATFATGGSAAPLAIPTGVATGKTVGDSLKFFSSRFLENIKVNEKEYKRLVIVFDDLERADMKPCELFGYLNEYIEHLHVPCILLADKDKWEEAQSQPDDKKTLQNLSSTQEKVIGKIFQIQTSVEDVINAWLSPECGCLDVNDDVKKIWWENRECIYDLFACFDNAKQKYLEKKDDFSFNDSEQKKFDQEQMKEYVQKMPNRNYRALRQTIKDFNHLCAYFCPQLGDLIFSKKSKERGFDKYFIRYFFAMRYGCWLGLFDPNQIEVSRYFFVGLKFGEREYPAEKNSLTAWDCFSNVCYKMDKIENFPMQKWIVDSFFDREKIVAEINSSAWFGGRDAYLIRQMYHWWSLSDKEAQEAYVAVKNALKNGTLNDSASLMVVFVVLYTISEDYSSNNKQSVVKEMNEYLDNYSKSIEFSEILSIEEIKQNYRPSDDCIEKLIAFRERLLKICSERENPFQEEKEQFYRNLISDDVYEFDSACSVIRNISYKVTKFQWSMVDAEKFVDGFSKLERYKKGEILEIMRHRYLNVPSGYDMEKEKVFLAKLKDVCLSRIDQKGEIPLPSTFALKQMVKKVEEIENIQGLFEKEEKN